jgi:hypothetical protein
LNQAPGINIEKVINTPVKKMTEHDCITEQRETRKPGKRKVLKKGSE